MGLDYTIHFRVRYYSRWTFFSKRSFAADYPYIFNDVTIPKWLTLPLKCHHFSLVIKALGTSRNLSDFKSATTLFTDFVYQAQFVIVKVFYLLLLKVSFKFSISFHLTVSRPRGRIISFHLLCVAPDYALHSLRFGLPYRFKVRLRLPALFRDFNTANL